ncbi:peptidoglycan-binding protein [Galactobacter valiniphilus]|uniref:peptidoglycan-binding protein n=1 Tax=Galactobacter valiniphilus TaxID=2676122 RepID=UPI0037350B84
MAVTRLDWDVLASNSDRLVTFPWVTGKVRKGDAYTVLDYLARRFNDEVEKITKAHSWGYAARDVRGASGVTSEHNAGTAVDFNAPKHVLGKSGTFTSAQATAIRKILSADVLENSIRWGGDYPGRKDEMHFELQGGADKLARVAKAIKALDSGTASKPSKPKPAQRTLAEGDTGADVKRLQAGLNKAFPAYSKFTGNGDGKYGPYTVQVVKEFQRRTGLKADGVVGPTTIKALRKHGINL